MIQLEDAKKSAANWSPIIQAYINATMDTSRGATKSSLVGIKAIAKYAQTDSGTPRAMTYFFKRSLSSAGKALNLTDILGRRTRPSPNMEDMD